MDEYVLDEVVAILIASNVDERHARTISTTFTNSLKIVDRKSVV